MIHWAQRYIEHGWPVFPVRDRSKTPMVPWKHLQEVVTPLGQADAWWGRWPEAAIGLATGATSGVIVLDADSADAAADARRILPATLTCLTPRGIHLYFAHPGFRVKNMQKVIIAGCRLDVRGDGGYSVLPPSVHETNVRYGWDGGEPWQGSVAVLPPDVLDQLKGTPAPTHAFVPTTSNGSGLSNGDGPRGYAMRILEDEARELEVMEPDSGRNSKLSKAAYSVGGFVPHVIDFTTVRDRLALAARQCGMPDGEFWKTLNAQMQVGMTRPREVPQAFMAAAYIGPVIPATPDEPARSRKLRARREEVTPDGDGAPALELVRNYLLSVEPERGLGLSWRSGGKAYASVPGRELAMIDVSSRRPEYMVQVLRYHSAECWGVRSDPLLTEAQRLYIASYVWDQAIRTAFQEVMDRLPERPADEITSAEMADLGRLIFNALTFDRMVQKEGLEKPCRTTLVRELGLAENADWHQVGQLEAYVKTGELALKTTALLNTMGLRGIQDYSPQAIGRYMTENGVGDNQRIYVGHRRVRAYVIDLKWMLSMGWEDERDPNAFAVPPEGTSP